MEEFKVGDIVVITDWHYAHIRTPQFGKISSINRLDRFGECYGIEIEDYNGESGKWYFKDGQFRKATPREVAKYLADGKYDVDYFEAEERKNKEEMSSIPRLNNSKNMNTQDYYPYGQCTGTTSESAIVTSFVGIGNSSYINSDAVKARLETLLEDKPELRDTLEELFPEIIEPKSMKIEWTIYHGYTVDSVFRALEIRQAGEYAHKAFFLSNRLNWSILIDSEGNRVLVPTRKK